MTLLCKFRQVNDAEESCEAGLGTEPCLCKQCYKRSKTAVSSLTIE